MGIQPPYSSHSPQLQASAWRLVSRARGYANGRWPHQMECCQKIGRRPYASRLEEMDNALEVERYNPSVRNTDKRGVQMTVVLEALPSWRPSDAQRHGAGWVQPFCHSRHAVPVWPGPQAPSHVPPGDASQLPGTFDSSTKWIHHASGSAALGIARNGLCPAGYGDVRSASPEGQANARPTHSPCAIAGEFDPLSYPQATISLEYDPVAILHRDEACRRRCFEEGRGPERFWSGIYITPLGSILTWLPTLPFQRCIHRLVSLHPHPSYTEAQPGSRVAQPQRRHPTDIDTYVKASAVYFDIDRLSLPGDSEAMQQFREAGSQPVALAARSWCRRPHCLASQALRAKDKKQPEAQLDEAQHAIALDKEHANRSQLGKQYGDLLARSSPQAQQKLADDVADIEWSGRTVDDLCTRAGPAEYQERCNAFGACMHIPGLGQA